MDNFPLLPSRSGKIICPSIVRILRNVKLSNDKMRSSCPGCLQQLFSPLTGKEASYTGTHAGEVHTPCTLAQKRLRLSFKHSPQKWERELFCHISKNLVQEGLWREEMRLTCQKRLKITKSRQVGGDSCDNVDSPRVFSPSPLT